MEQKMTFFNSDITQLLDLFYVNYVLLLLYYGIDCKIDAVDGDIRREKECI